MFFRLKAPFASFRPFQSGSYRSTTPVPAPTTIYGLLLNLAAIEQRTATSEPITLIRDDLPEMEIAMGLVSPQQMAILCQQLHSYPVGSSGRELAKRTFGAKHWIAPVRREVLVDLEIVVGVRTSAELKERIRDGLEGKLALPRYGLPFAGDNNFLFDVIEVIEQPEMARWYCPLLSNARPSPGICRLTTRIDRKDNTQTLVQVFAPTDFRLEPPTQAWIGLPK